MGYSFISAYANLPNSSCHFWKHKSVFLQIWINLQCTIQYASIYNFASIYNIIYVAWSFWRGGSFEGGPKLPLDETRYEEVLIKKVFYLTQRKYQENQGSMKVGLSSSIKNCLYLLPWKPF